MASGAKIVFRGGSRTNAMLTPRPGRDTTPTGGLTPGLSVEDTLEAAFGDKNKKAQKVDLSRLQPPLKYFPDDPSAEAAQQGHGVIAPAGADGQMDQAALDEWASHRDTQGDAPHRLTQLVIDAIVESNVRRT